MGTQRVEVSPWSRGLEEMLGVSPWCFSCDDETGEAMQVPIVGAAGFHLHSTGCLPEGR